ncbi:MAG: TRAP transporter substrate-binding protein [Burkholderiaceae bacterium]
MKPLKMFTAAVAVGLMSQGAVAQTTWEMPTPYPEAEFHTKNVRQFVADIAKATGGSLTINVHSAQSLFKHPEIKRAVQTGQVPIAEMLMANLLNEDPIFGVDAVPFLASTYDEAAKLWRAQRPLAEEKLAKQGLRLLYAVPWPGQGFYTKSPIASLDDLKGVKFRTYNSATASLAKLMGAVPTIVEAVEIPQAFSTGVVDAMVTSGATGLRTKAWDFSQNFYDLNAWMPKNMVFINERAWRKLSDAERSAVEQAGKEAEKRGWAMSQEIANASNSELAKNGMKVSSGSDKLIDQLKKIGTQMTAEWEKKAGEDGAKLLSSYRK